MGRWGPPTVPTAWATAQNATGAATKFIGPFSLEVVVAIGTADQGTALPHCGLR